MRLSETAIQRLPNSTYTRMYRRFMKLAKKGAAEATPGHCGEREGINKPSPLSIDETLSRAVGLSQGGPLIPAMATSRTSRTDCSARGQRGQEQPDRAAPRH